MWLRASVNLPTGHLTTPVPQSKAAVGRVLSQSPSGGVAGHLSFTRLSPRSPEGWEGEGHQDEERHVFSGAGEGHRKESGNHGLVSLNGKKPQQQREASLVAGPPENRQGIGRVP